MIKNNSEWVRLQDYLKDASIPKANIDNEKKKEDNIQRLKKVINKFEINKNKNNSYQKLNKLQIEIQETSEIVLSSYESDDIMPNSVVSLLLKAENCKYIYMQRINELSLKKLENNVNNIENKLGKTIKEIDNIWGNVISVILSFSMVAAFIEGISKVDKEFIPLFSIGVVWVGMTLLVFFSNLFENKKMENNTAKFMYTLVCILTLIIGILTSIYVFTSVFVKSNTINNSNSNVSSVPVIANEEEG